MEETPYAAVAGQRERIPCDTIAMSVGFTPTYQLALQAGARVIDEPRMGYGRACLTGLAALEDDVDVIVDPEDFDLDGMMGMNNNLGSMSDWFTESVEGEIRASFKRA